MFKPLKYPVEHLEDSSQFEASPRQRRCKPVPGDVEHSETQQESREQLFGGPTKGGFSLFGAQLRASAEELRIALLAQLAPAAAA